MRMNINHLSLPTGIIQLIEAYGDKLSSLKDKPIVIAIDGHSSCGKSTLSKDLAKAIGYRYIDTGAMYRAVALYLLRAGTDIADSDAVASTLPDIDIEFALVDGVNTTFLNDENVESEIRTLRVSQVVSEVAAITPVRRHLVAQQQKMGERKAIVMDGRDIGTVVFPQAALKIFMTADITTRSQRRYDELKNKGQEQPLELVQENLTKRDHIDSTREDSPLKQADDAIVIDSTHLNQEQQLAEAVKLVFDTVA